MTMCYFCNQEVELPYQCNYCNQIFCFQHRLPPNHDCSNIREWKSWSGPSSGTGEKSRSWKAGGEPVEPTQKPLTRVPAPIKAKNRRRNFSFYKIQKTLRYIALIPFWLVLSFIPLLVGLGFIYLLDPGMAMLTPFWGTETTFQLLILGFLSPSNSIILWLAWIVSGFVGGLVFGRVLIPFLLTYGLAWTIFYYFGGPWTEMLGLLGGEILIRVVVLNAFIALLAFGFGGFIGSAIRR